MSGVVLRSEMTAAYRDPMTRRDILAYVPEYHASRSCGRSLPGGSKLRLPNDHSDLVFCDLCTTDDPERATRRRTPDGGWVDS